MIPVDELRPLSAARLLALWRDCREAAEDPPGADAFVQRPGTGGVLLSGRRSSFR